VAFFQGDQLKLKVKKVCDGYHATIFSCPSDFDERFNIKRDLLVRLADMETVISKTKDHRMKVFSKAAASFDKWSVMLKKLKAIYHEMNKFNVNVSEKCLVGECWIPKSEVQVVQNSIAQTSMGGKSFTPAFLNVIQTKETPPTFQRTNKFTVGFQALIDAYGVASYREANPGLYTIITFPFLFAVMYGDIGHGLILTLIASWMVFIEKKLSKIKGEIFNLFFSGRYIILLMGLFSIYTGFIYNDIFSKSMNLFGSSWRINYNVSTVMKNPKLQLNPSSDAFMTDRVYPMGFDPVWAVAPDNKILFFNSYKMKLSIIFGVVHMLLGISVNITNHNFFKNRAMILLEFLPQTLFLLFMFGYLVFMIFFKWIMFNPKSEAPFSPGCAPSVLVYFINMMLFGKEKPADGCDAYMYPGQRAVQIAFVVFAVLCIPWMLMGKPLFIKIQRTLRGANHGENEYEPMNEIWTHQAIHTIEFVLGTISHTASYLRLWALSLAHAQLSEVLWSRLMTIGFLPIPFIGPVMLFYVFAVWSVLTFAILVVIEGLSAFLHTLRLHWVEFMSKFYDGNGKKFEPFSFQTILNGSD
jgi:V-type H+-transporting ATPase subunit a